VGSLAGGESLKAIGRAFGKPSSSIYYQVAPHGGIRPLPRRRSRLALTFLEREEISRGIAAHRSARSMARLLGHSPSTVSREISRNGGYDRYRAAVADEQAWARARRPKRCKLLDNPRLRAAVARKLRLNWSPERIAGWLKRHREDEANRVSHETVYRSLFVQARGVLRKELLGHLRSKRTIRRSQRADPDGDRRGQIKDIVSIRQRPAVSEVAAARRIARGDFRVFRSGHSRGERGDSQDDKDRPDRAHLRRLSDNPPDNVKTSGPADFRCDRQHKSSLRPVSKRVDSSKAPTDDPT
jgi:hypothetical protein